MIRAKAFGLKLYAFDKYIDTEFVKKHSIKICNTLEKLFSRTDIISLNMNLNKENKKCITREILDNHTKRGLLLINTARGELVDEKAIIYGIKNLWQVLIIK